MDKSTTKVPNLPVLRDKWPFFVDFWMIFGGFCMLQENLGPFCWTVSYMFSALLADFLTVEVVGLMVDCFDRMMVGVNGDLIPVGDSLLMYLVD
jgi:hypothetical protein